MNDNEIISDFLSNASLYKKHSLNYRLEGPFTFEDRTFSFYCKTDNSLQTFKLRVEPDELISLTEDKLPLNRLKTIYGLQEFDEDREYFNFTVQCTGTCQYCGSFKVHFLLRYESVDTITEQYGRLMKIGQFPPFEIKPNRDLMKFLSSEDQENYRKSLICQSQSYGVASFAYLRRIVENEMIRLVEALSEIDRRESKEIKKLLENFKVDHVMTTLIEGIYQYLPSSLKSIGSNPLKILYGQLSGGIHEFSDDECLNKAENMDILLNFVVKKIKEENSEVLEAREALKGLTK